MGDSSSSHFQTFQRRLRKGKPLSKRPADLARMLNTTPQVVNRLTNLNHATKIDGIAKAIKALGKTLEIRAV